LADMTSRRLRSPWNLGLRLLVPQSATLRTVTPYGIIKRQTQDMANTV
jgi:hypothetical protein